MLCLLRWQLPMVQTGLVGTEKPPLKSLTCSVFPCKSQNEQNQELLNDCQQQHPPPPTSSTPGIKNQAVLTSESNRTEREAVKTTTNNQQRRWGRWPKQPVWECVTAAAVLIWLPPPPIFLYPIREGTKGGGRRQPFHQVCLAAGTCLQTSRQTDRLTPHSAVHFAERYLKKIKRQRLTSKQARWTSLIILPCLDNTSCFNRRQPSSNVAKRILPSVTREGGECKYTSKALQELLQ